MCVPASCLSFTYFVLAAFLYTFFVFVCVCVRVCVGNLLGWWGGGVLVVFRLCGVSERLWLNDNNNVQKRYSLRDIIPGSDGLGHHNDNIHYRECSGSWVYTYTVQVEWEASCLFVPPLPPSTLHPPCRTNNIRHRRVTSLSLDIPPTAPHGGARDCKCCVVAGVADRGIPGQSGTMEESERHHNVRDFAKHCG